MKIFLKIWEKINAILFIVIILLGGGYAASMFWLQVNSSYQDRIFQTIANKTVTDSMTDIEKIQSLTEITHRLLGPPRKRLLLPPMEIRGFKDKKIHSADVALLGGYACYMHALVVGELLTKAGFDFRFFSMIKEGKSHHIGQVFYNGRYVALDALYNQMFVKPNGDYATVEEVHENWDYYKQQVGNKLLFTDPPYDRLPYYPVDFYRQYYDYTPMRPKPPAPKQTLISTILGFKDDQTMLTQLQLNRYLFWQIKLSKIYLLVLLGFIIDITAYFILRKRFWIIQKVDMA